MKGVTQAQASHTPGWGCAQGRGRWADAPIDNECAPPSRWESVGAIDEPDNEGMYFSGGMYFSTYPDLQWCAYASGRVDWSLYMYVTIIGNDLPPHHAERSPSFIRKGGRSLREPDKGYSEHYQKGFKQSRYSLSFSSRHQVGSNIIITALMEMESLLGKKRS